MTQQTSSFFSGKIKIPGQSLLTLLIILINLSVSAQKKSEIVMTIGGEPVSKDEFIANYQKNNTNILDAKDKKTPAEYLDLFINFKLKVLEAEKLGYDTAKSFITELNGYRQELIKPYMTNVSYNEEMVQTAYHRTRFERKASHILILVNPDSSPEDTLAAWNRISDLRKQIIAGADFNEIATRNSQDPSAAQNHGLLGYFSAFQMVYPFEDMTYRTPVGQVSEIVRTRFGYHLIKVHDERPTPGEIKVAHIMKMFPQQASDETIARLKLTADSIWQLATSGSDFAELAKKYSDDKQSAGDGGTLNWFSPTNMIPTFADAAFALKNNGDISPVIRTPYGWHIIKRIELRTIQPLEKLRSGLETKIKQNPEISKHSDEAFDRKLRAEYELKIDEVLLAQLSASLTDSLKLKEIKDRVLVSFANQQLKLGEFSAYLKNQSFAVGGTNTEVALKTMLDKFINKKLLEYENTQLERKHPDFARIYKEYHDGILLFNISKDKIWDAATTDTARMQKFYAQTTKKYYWDNRFKGWILNAKNAEIRAKAESILDANATDKKEITDVLNTKTENNIEIKEVAVEKGENPIVDYYIWNGPKPAQFDETTTFVHGKVVQKEEKTLKDAWGLYSSDFQEQLEKEWISSLREKYPVKINTKVLKKIPTVE